MSKDNKAPEAEKPADRMVLVSHKLNGLQILHVGDEIVRLAPGKDTAIAESLWAKIKALRGGKVVSDYGMRAVVLA